MTISKDELEQLVTKLEGLDSDKSYILEEIKKVYADADSQGFDIKTLKQIIELRKMDKDKLAHQEALLNLYRNAIGL